MGALPPLLDNRTLFRQMELFHADRSRAFSCGRRKEYPDGSYELLVCTRPIFKVPGWEDHYSDEIAVRRSKLEETLVYTDAVTRDLRSLGWESVAVDEAAARENVRRAARRAASRVRDLALSNDFSYFVTLTLDKEKIDRYDISVITKKLNQWLDNMVRRKGLRYILVPELHEDGAYHFHGFVNDAGDFASSGTWKVPGKKKPVKPRSKRQAASWARQGPEAGFHEVFNWETWPLGFTSAIKLYGDYGAAVAYVCKYVTKQTREAGGKIAGRWYFSGGELREPTITYPDISLQDLEATTPALFRFEIPEAHAKFGLYREIRQKRSVDCAAEAAQQAAEASGEDRETIPILCIEEGCEDDNAISARQRGGPGSRASDAVEPASAPGESTHGAQNQRRLVAENREPQTSVLGDGTEDRETEACGPARAAFEGPEKASGENLGFRTSDRPGETPPPLDGLERCQAGGGGL